jgi:cytochrome c oxidase cbb3-type subunit 4
MENTTLLGQIADNWLLVSMFTYFVAVAIWAFLPSQSKAREDASMIPMRNEDVPLQTKKTEKTEKTCSGTCDTCTRTSDFSAMRGLSNG